MDPPLHTVLHPGQTSLREHNPEDGSLHIAFGRDGHFDTHIDRVGAVGAPDTNSRSAVADPARAVEHNVTEVFPEKIRKYSPGGYFPGVVAGPGPDLPGINRSRPPAAGDKSLDPARLKPDNFIGGNIVFQVAEEENRIPLDREPDTAFVDDAVLEHAVPRGAAEGTPVQLRRKDLKPNHPEYGNSADPEALAGALAGHIANAARESRTIAEIRLPEYYCNLSDGERKAIAATIGRMANAVAAELPDIRDVRYLKISFGSRNEFISLADRI